MPLAAAIPLLVEGFLSIFEEAPRSTAEAGSRWSTAYAAYCLAGGATILPPRQQALASALEVAFNPDAGAGASGLIAALAAFWPGTPVPGMAPTAQAVAFTPSGDLSLILPGVNDEAPAAQARALAQAVHALTVASVKVVIPPSPALVPIV
jgi:hypothetical protein